MKYTVDDIIQILENHHSSYQEMEQYYQKGWFNIYRIKKLVDECDDIVEVYSNNLGFTHQDWMVIYQYFFNKHAEIAGDETRIQVLRPTADFTADFYEEQVLNDFKLNSTEEIKLMTGFVTKHYFGGRDLSECEDGDIFKFIKALEKEIDDLKAMKATSKKAEAKITELQNQVNELVKYVDER